MTELILHPIFATHLVGLKKVYCLIILFTILARPLFYLGATTYYYSNLDEIVEKYCVNKKVKTFKCNGKCHLAKTISFETEDNDKTTFSIVEAIVPLYYIENNSQNFYFSEKEFNKIHTFYSLLFKSNFKTVNSPPPKSFA